MEYFCLDAHAAFEVLEGCGDGGADHLGCLVPTAVLTIRGGLVLAVLVLLSVLSYPPDGLVLVVNSFKLLFMCPCQHQIVRL